MKNLFLILFFVGICYSQEGYNKEQYQYLFIMKDFNTPYSINDLAAMGRLNINAAGGQPFRLTSLYQPNTNYTLLAITPVDNDQKSFFETLAMNYNFITKISSGNVVTKWTRFGNIRVWEQTIFNDLPADFYDNYAVVIGTP